MTEESNGGVFLLQLLFKYILQNTCMGVTKLYKTIIIILITTAKPERYFLG